MHGLRVVIYPNDHRPAHVHVIGRGCEAVFKLNCPAGPVNLRENQGFQRAELNRIATALARHLPDACPTPAPNGAAFMELTDEAVAAANRRAQAQRSQHPGVLKARFDRRTARLVLNLDSGLQVAFLPAQAQGLEQATADELAEIEISPSGLGLHFPRLDADLYVPALLEGFLGSRRWLAQQRGRLGGVANTEAKAQAARRNGRLGGRPRKVAVLG